jgi:hypothetical protein
MRFVMTIVVALCAAVLTAGTASATTDPVAHASAKCNISGKERDLGATYVTSVTATRVSCSSALKIVKAFHKCRKANGPAGRCVKRVSGYACSERRESIPTQFDARATCKKGKRTIVQQYTQNT